MGKVLRCGEIMEGCPYEARGTEEEILRKAGVHAKEAHGVDVTPELAAKVRKTIKDE